MATIQLASDNFNRADQNPLGAPGWTAMANDPDNDWIPNQIISNQVFPTDVDLDALSFYDAIMWPNDQWGAVTCGSTFTAGNSAEVGVELRAQGINSEEDYEVTIYNQASPSVPAVWNIFVTTGGSNFIELASGLVLTGDNLIPGSVVYGQIVGDVISVYLNGQLQGSATDDTYSGGSVGLLQTAVDATGIMGSSISLWQGGGFSTSTPATPYAMLDRVEGRGVSAPVILTSAFYNPFKQDILQVAQPGGRVVWNLNSSGVATTNPSSPTKGTMLGPYYGSTFADAWTNKNNLDIFQVVNAGGKVIFHVNSLGIASTP